MNKTKTVALRTSRRLPPASLPPSHSQPAQKTPNGLPLGCRHWNPSIAKLWCFASRKSSRCRKYPQSQEHRYLQLLQESIEASQPCGLNSGKNIMRADIHEQFQRLIDESLAGGITAEKERALRDHLHNCAPCQEYLSASNRVITSLSG